MKANSTFWVSIVDVKTMPGAYHASFRVPGEPPRWVIEKNERKVFTNRNEAELAAYRVMCAHLNNLEVAITFSQANAKEKTIRAFRAEGVGKGSGPIKDPRAEADKVFSKFGKDK